MAATDPQAIIDALDAAVLKSAQRGFPLSYVIAGRTLTFQSLKQITDLRSYWASLVATSGATGSYKPSRVQLPGGPPQ